MASSSLSAPLTLGNIGVEHGPTLARIAFDALNSSTLPLKAPDQAVLMPFFRNLAVLDRQPALPKSCPPNYRLGTLFKLPPETRHIICCLLITEGRVAILQASKSINQEASHFIFKEGTCCMTLGIPDPLPMTHPSHDTTKGIQHVRLRVDGRQEPLRCESYDYEFLHMFSACNIHQKSCTVSSEV